MKRPATNPIAIFIKSVFKKKRPSLLTGGFFLAMLLAYANNESQNFFFIVCRDQSNAEK